ncbi:MAG: glycoside hydrolase family 2 TIM barrel-domain containing protein [Thermoleophilaceae bacterium]
MRSALAATVVAAGLAIAPGAVAAPDLSGVSGPRPLETVDLAGTWDFAPENGAATTIQVPGGGWYKQGFDVPEATYSRQIVVPQGAAGNVVRLELGAVNHQATVFVDGRELGTQTTSYTGQMWDLTGHVTPGDTHQLRIHVKGRQGLVTGLGKDTPILPGYIGPTYLVPTGVEWSESTAQGIFGWARLTVHPAIFIDDAFVRTSVQRDELAVDVWLRNGGSSAETVELQGALGGGDLAYPALPARTVTLAAGETRTVTVGPVRWGLGRESYWWPNVPYRKGYRAQLHELELRAGEAAHRVRFGFREFRQAGTRYELNGVRVNHRGDSLGGAGYDRIDHGGKGDAFHTFPGFLPPTEATGGWPQAVDNYQRLNMNVVRIHQIPASPYMLDVADEMGLMIVGETGIRGSQSRQAFDEAPENFVEHTKDLVVRDRNHASVVRWSQANEPDLYSGDSLEFERELYDTIRDHDGTRPISIDVSSEPYDELPDEDFASYQHYFDENGMIAPGYTDDVHPRDDRPFGRGEFIWPLSSTPQGFTWFATATQKMREKDASDIRPYAVISAWPAVVPGVRRTDLITEELTVPLYGEDNLPDPWSNPQIQRIQAGFHPTLVADSAYWERHKRSDPLGRWPTPTQPTTARAGRRVDRELVIFNDTFAGEDVDVRWQLRRGSPTGAVLEEGGFRVAVALGSRARRTITFTAPATPGERVHLVLSTFKDGRERFRDGEQWFLVTP